MMSNVNTSVPPGELAIISDKIPENVLIYSNGNYNEKNTESTQSKKTSSIKKTEYSIPQRPSNVEMVNLSQHSKFEDPEKKTFGFQEENGISKGVILNAGLFSKKRAVSDKQTNNFSDETPQNVLQDKKPVPLEQKAPMSLARKFAFGFSFLPSILFVLGFAIIFPCREINITSACVNQHWTLFLNNTVLAADFGVSDSLVVGLSSRETGQIVSIDKSSGKTLWTWDLNSPPNFIDCNDFDVDGDGISDCLIIATSTYLQAVNASNGFVFSNIGLDTDDSPRPVILRGCDGHNLPRMVAIAGPSRLKLLKSDLSVAYTLTLEGCRDVPRNLLAWNHQNQTDLIFVCADNEGKYVIRLLKSTDWCQEMKKEKAVIPLRLMSDIENIENVSFLPCPEGFVVWVGQRIIYYDREGIQRWRVFTDRSDEKFLVYGNYSLGEQIAVIGSNENNGSLITLLNIDGGSTTFTHFISGNEVVKALRITESKKDYLLLLMEEFLIGRFYMGVSESIYAEDSQPDEMLMTYDFSSIPYQHMTRQRTVLIDFREENSRESILKKELSVYTYDVVRRSSKDSTKLSAYMSYGGDENILNIFIGRTVLQTQDTSVDVFRNNTYLRAFSAKSWDKFSSCE